MTKKILKIVICLAISLCVLCGGTSVFAENGDVDVTFNIRPVEPEIPEETTAATQPATTEKVTKPQTTKEETTKREPTKAETKKEETTKKQPTQVPTRRPTNSNNNKNNNNNSNNNNNNNSNNNNNNNNNRPNNNYNANVNNTPVTTTPETTEKPLPEGAFYVYLELNDGSETKKTVMEKAGLVPEPSEPTREGFVFDGWYSDEKFENEWNFFVDKASKEMTVYAKWVADPNAVVYKISIAKTVGGKIKVTPDTASEGEAVAITITPDDGKRLTAGSLMINGKPSDVLSFVMPAEDVTISASFEDIPASENNNGEEPKSFLPIILICAAVIIAVGVVIFVIYTKRRNAFDPDYDPDNPIIDDADEEVWIDDTIVVEDGFKEGKIVKENIEPDFGLPEDSMFGDVGADDIEPEE